VKASEALRRGEYNHIMWEGSGDRRKVTMTCGERRVVIEVDVSDRDRVNVVKDVELPPGWKIPRKRR